jgi:hypothetical protein
VFISGFKVNSVCYKLVVKTVKFFDGVGSIKVRGKPKHVDKNKVNVFAIVLISFAIYAITTEPFIGCNCVKFSGASKHFICVILNVDKLYGRGSIESFDPFVVRDRNRS